MTSRHLTVAIPTYRRPETLARGIPEILRQARALAAQQDMTIEVLVVDNDPDGSARSVVEQFLSADLRYVVEPVAGIVAARNRALQESADADLLVFIDDDEIPRPQWLSSLVQTYQLTEATGVMGRVVSHLPQTVDPWIAAGDFFERPRYPTGTPLQIAATGNLLLDRKQVDSFGLRFSERFALSSGEDSLFSRQLVQRGGRLVFCNESVVDDKVNVDRVTRRWLLRRAWSQGNARSRVELALADSVGQRAVLRVVLAARGGLRVLGGAGRLLLGVVIGSLRHQARGMRTVRRGLGMAAGAVGVTYEEYSR